MLFKHAAIKAMLEDAQLLVLQPASCISARKGVVPEPKDRLLLDVVQQVSGLYFKIDPEVDPNDVHLCVCIIGQASSHSSTSASPFLRHLQANFSGRNDTSLLWLLFCAKLRPSGL